MVHSKPWKEMSISLTLFDRRLQQSSQVIQGAIIVIPVIRDTEYVGFHEVLITSKCVLVVSGRTNYPNKAIGKSFL